MDRAASRQAEQVEQARIARLLGIMFRFANDNRAEPTEVGSREHGVLSRV